MTSSLSFAVTLESRPPRRFPSSLVDQVLWFGVFGLLLFGPLAFGAVEPWSSSIMQVGAGLLFALWAVRQVAAGELEIVGNPLFLPMLLFAGSDSGQLATGRTAYRCRHFFDRAAVLRLWTVCFLVVQCVRRTSQVKALAWCSPDTVSRSRCLL